jgi:hypothetical protein
VQDVIEAVKQTIKTANVSTVDAERDLRVGTVGLTLRDTHEIEINLTPPSRADRVRERRAGQVTWS